MKRMLSKLLSILLIFVFLTLQTACTKEKAEALKSAAEQFRVEADATFTKVSGLLKESVTVTPQSREDELKSVVRQLNSRPSWNDVELLTFTNETLKGTNLSKPAVRAIDEQFGKLSDEYELFASMFRSLPRGYVFAKDIVPKAERHSIRLTLRMIKMAKELDKNPITNQSKRADIIIRLLRAQALTDPVAKNQEFTLIAQQILDLRASEEKANNDAIVQCLKAAEAGKTASELIKNYSKFTVTDMLNAIKNSLNTINAITGGSNPDIKTLITKFDGFVATKVATDPLWSDVLNTEFSGNLAN